jgi:hypothetical protein
MNRPTQFLPLYVVVSRDEIESRDFTAPFAALKSLIASPATARAHMESVDVAFSGYDEDARELFEIPEVREYVYRLDGEFPYWLFFLSKYGLGLQCLLLSFLPPHLTDEAKANVHPERIRELLLNRWLPAMNQVSEFAGLTGDEVDRLTERALDYISNGRLPLPGRG